MLKKLSIAAALALSLGVVPMFGHAAVEGCAAGGGQSTGGFTATTDGGIIAGGDGVVTVTHADDTVDTYSNTVSNIGDGDIVAGDVVTCSATNGLAIAGNPNA